MSEAALWNGRERVGLSNDTDSIVVVQRRRRIKLDKDTAHQIAEDDGMSV